MTMKLKILIVDDEQLARSYLSSILKKSDLEIELHEAQDAIEALKMIQEISPQIVYLDIEMPEMSGIDLIRQLEPLDFAVVFQTAFSEYAVQAFEMNACDYILKPYEKDRVMSSLCKAVDYNNKKQSNNIKQALDKFKPLKNIVVTQYNMKLILEVSEIEYFRSENHQTLLILNDREYVCGLSLDKIERKLDSKEFYRIHRDSIVRIKDISRILKKGHNFMVKLKNNKELPLARSRKKDLMNIIED
jgi:two-component system LytT family response regulator